MLYIKYERTPLKKFDSCHLRQDHFPFYFCTCDELYKVLMYCSEYDFEICC